jgi:hypothetical protein
MTTTTQTTANTTARRPRTSYGWELHVIQVVRNFVIIQAAPNAERELFAERLPPQTRVRLDDPEQAETLKAWMYRDGNVPTAMPWYQPTPSWAT